MTDPLNRTRRNMIGVSVFLILQNSFGWKFPEKLNVFGYEMPTSATAFGLLIWLAFVYLVVEYWVHIRKKAGGYVSRWRALFVALHGKEVLREMRYKFHSQGYENIAQQLVRQEGWTSFTGLHLVEIQPDTGGRWWEQRMQITKVFAGKYGDQPKFASFGAKERIEFDYLNSLHWVIAAFFQLVYQHEEMFEYVLPILFPIFALIAATTGPYELLR